MVLTPEADVGFVEVSGERQRIDLWSRAAEAHLGAAAEAALLERGFQAAAQDQRGLDAFRADALRALDAMPAEVDEIAWSVAPPAGDAPADYALVLTAAADVNSSGHRVMEGVVNAFFGVVVPPAAGAGATRAALIDLKTGAPVWYADHERADARDPDDARAIVRRLFKTFPDLDD